MKTSSELLGLVLASTAVVGCAAIKNALSSDPVGDHTVQAIRVPAGRSDRACRNRCDQSDHACMSRNEATGQTSHSDGMVCRNMLWDCLSACPGADLYSNTYKNMKSSVAATRACTENLPQGAKMTCYYSKEGLPINTWEDYVVEAAAPAAAAPAAASTGGDARKKVLARYRSGNYWFVGTVVDRSGDTVQISYLDGTSETLAAANVRPFDWTTGTRVACQWKRQPKWYAGMITALDGNNARIRYEDGDVEDTSIAFCRSNLLRQ